MKNVQLASAILLIIGSMLNTAFAATTCDYYGSKTVQLENAKEFTQNDRSSVAGLFRTIAATCIAKGADAVSKIYNDAASGCDKKKNCKENYNNLINNKGKFKDTISTTEWCGFIGAGRKTSKGDPTQAYMDLVHALNYCASNSGYDYDHVLHNAADISCLTTINGKKVVNPNPPVACTHLIDKLYQAKPNWSH